MCKHTFYYILGNKKYPEIYILQNHYKISTCSICALTFADPALCKLERVVLIYHNVWLGTLPIGLLVPCQEYFTLAD